MVNIYLKKSYNVNSKNIEGLNVFIFEQSTETMWTKSLSRSRKKISWDFFQFSKFPEIFRKIKTAMSYFKFKKKSKSLSFPQNSITLKFPELSELVATLIK